MLGMVNPENQFIVIREPLASRVPSTRVASSIGREYFEIATHHRSMEAS